MKLFIYITTFLTGLATIFVWTSMNVLTPVFDADLYTANADGLFNGFYFKIGFIFIIYFCVMATILLRDVYAKLTQQTRLILLIAYGFLFILVVFRTMSSAFQLKNALNGQQNEVVFSMLNAYSTDIFFNFFTFIGLFVFLSLISLFLPAPRSRSSYNV